MKAGVIGLGQIGGGIAQCLARASMLSAAYDIRDDIAPALGLDLLPSASPGEVARRSDAVIVAVVNAAQAIDVLTGPTGILTAARPGTMIILVATVSLDDLARIRALTDTAGLPLIDSGVVGGLKAAEGGLICLVGAEREQLVRVMPIFDGFARYVAHMGGPGSGMAGKIIYNAIFHSTLRAGREGAMLAEACAVDVRQLDRIFRDSIDVVGGPMRFVVSPGDPLEDVDLATERERMANVMAKDLDAALAMATKEGLNLPMVQYTRATLSEVVGIMRPR
jgi:3-hydroxyisobutyrate dehydrogenase